MSENSLTVGDSAPALSGTINANGTGGSGKLHIRKPTGQVLTVDATMGAFDPATGKTSWSYDWAAGDLSVDGRWKVELEFTYSNQKKQTFGPIWFLVKPQMA